MILGPGIFKNMEDNISEEPAERVQSNQKEIS